MEQHQIKLCPHGQEFYCRICGTISHLAQIEEKPETTSEKKDYSGDRGSIFHYYEKLKNNNVVANQSIWPSMLYTKDGWKIDGVDYKG